MNKCNSIFGQIREISTGMNSKEWSEKPSLKKEPKALAPGINSLPCFSANWVKLIPSGKSVED